MLDILIKNATIVTVNQKRDILRNAAIAIQGDRIADIGPTGDIEARYPQAAKVMDAAGKAVFPGMINTHNHLFQTNFKGLGDDRALKDWLKDVTWPGSTNLLPEDCYTGAMIGCIEGIRSGITTQVDYMYPHPREGLDDAVISAFKDLKIRAIFGRGYMDSGYEYGVQKAMAQTWQEIEADIERLYDTYHGAQDGRLHVWMAPAVPWTTSVECMQMTKRFYDQGVNLTIHTSETDFDREATLKVHGLLDTDVLIHYGLMGPRTLLVHCVRLDERDIRMIKACDARVSHNPNSNMYLASGVAPIPALNMAGITVGLGTDGAASNNSNDMLEILKATSLLQKVTHRDPTIMTADKVLEMATIEGARAVGLDHEVGSLEKGKKADLFIFNPERNMKAIPMHNPVSTLVYSSGMENIETSIIDGNIVLEDGALTLVDEAQMVKRCRAQADDLIRRAGINLNQPWRSIAY